MRYVITKPFRDPSGMRLPGELIELAPSRAGVLRGCGLIGGEYIEPEKDDERSDKAKTTKSTESRKRVK